MNEPANRTVNKSYIQGYNDCAAMFLRKPPGDWKPFGSSIDSITGKGPDYELEFAGEDEGGYPIWERPKPKPVSADQIMAAAVALYGSRWFGGKWEEGDVEIMEVYRSEVELVLQVLRIPYEEAP